MKKQHFLLALFLLFTGISQDIYAADKTKKEEKTENYMVWSAQENSRTGLYNLYKTDMQLQPFALTFYANYGYNYTWLNYGGATIQAYLPLNPHFEATLGARFLTSNVHAFNADFRPLFPLPVGALYISTRVLYTAAFRNNLQEAAASIGIGYRMDYVDVQFGLHGRLINSIKRDKHSEDQLLWEEPHLLYGVTAYVRPQTSNWNISLRFANYDDFQIERMWQPLFNIGGRYDINKHWRVLADVTCKPTGMFHLCASFYGIDVRAGATYLF